LDCFELDWIVSSKMTDDDRDDTTRTKGWRKEVTPPRDGGSRTSKSVEMKKEQNSELSFVRTVRTYHV
jgi:hypothetical protein